MPEDTSLRLVPEVGILKAALNVNIFNMIIGTIIIVFFPHPQYFLPGRVYIYLHAAVKAKYCLTLSAYFWTQPSCNRRRHS